MAIIDGDFQDEKGNSYRPRANPKSIATFSKASTRANIASGETHETIFGKIMKWFADIGTAAFNGIANNCTTIAAGFALDARQGKVLMDKANQISSDLGGFRFYEDETGKYVVGADAVPKKLGSGLKLYSISFVAASSAGVPYGSCAVRLLNDSETQIVIEKSFDNLLNGIYGSNSDSSIANSTSGWQTELDNGWQLIGNTQGIYDISNYKYLCFYLKFGTQDYVAAGGYHQTWQFG